MSGPTPTKRLLPIAIGLMVLMVAGLLYFKSCHDSAPRREPAAVGFPAPNLVLADMGGRSWSLAQLRGRKVLVAFWASWCPPCRDELASLQRLHDDPAVGHLTVLAVNAGETKEQVAAFLAREQLSLPVLLDVKGEVQERYGVYQLPLAFLVDDRGRIVARHLGLRDWHSAEAVAELTRTGKE